MSKDKDSKRTKRRANRKGPNGPFVNLETSSRKHRRAHGRLSRSCVIEGSHVAPGAKRFSAFKASIHIAQSSPPITATVLAISSS